MADERIRRQIALLAARLIHDRTESEYFTAKRKAAKQLGVEYRYTAARASGASGGETPPP